MPSAAHLSALIWAGARPPRAGGTKAGPSERAQLSMLAPDLRQSAFFDLWVLKEAALQIQRTGPFRLSRVEVSRSPPPSPLPGVCAALLPFRRQVITWPLWESPAPGAMEFY